jgi:hypothetical protein
MGSRAVGWQVWIPQLHGAAPFCVERDGNGEGLQPRHSSVRLVTSRVHNRDQPASAVLPLAPRCRASRRRSPATPTATASPTRSTTARRRPNPGQADYDDDRTGDACAPDDDEDGEFDAVDNCPLTYNYDQADADADGIGTACDGDERVGGGPGGSPGGGPASPTDRLAPTLLLRLARTQRLAALGAGLAVEVRCSEGCALQARLTVSRATALRLGIGSRKTTVAKGSAALAGRGTTYVFMRFQRGMTRRLGRRTVRAQLTLTAADEVGNKRTRDRVLRLRP